MCTRKKDVERFCCGFEVSEKFWRRFGAPLNEKSAQLVVLQLVTLILAEREGFEPPVPCGTPVFKTGVFDHSTISPYKW